MADAAQAQKSSGSGSRALLWLLIIILLGAVWWLASERNARKYTLASRDGVLVVSRGRYFPTGTGVIGPDDPEGKLYSGIALPAGQKSIAETEYDDQGALDRGLYALLSSTAHALAKRGDQASVADADGLAKRLSGLRGLSAEELTDLTALRAELAFWSAGGDVKAAVAALGNARRKLEEVRANGGEHAVMAGPLEEQLEPLAAQLSQLGARFSPGSDAAANGAAAQKVGTPTVGTPINVFAGDAAMPPLLEDGGTALVPIPSAPRPSIASPPGAPATNSIVPAQHGASAPGSVSSGASRGN